MQKVVERFLRYVQYDTQSREDADTFPSTSKQLTFAKTLVEELKDMGLKDASIDENGYVMATLPANINKEVPIIGFIAHMDTSPDMSGSNVCPKRVINYDGGDIVLNSEKNIILSPKDFPELIQYVRQDLITTDGNTLLGADDKAGIAEIMTAVAYLTKHPEIEHGTIKVAFTPDEEIGRGADYFDVKKFGAEFAYTMDGGALGELEYENFNAASAKIKVNGRNVHPGSAKNKMKNALLIGMEFNGMLPTNEIPRYTEGYEGFYHLNHMQGDVEEASMYYIVRDHDGEKFQIKKEYIEKIANHLNDKYGKNTIEWELKDQYYNMKEKIASVMHIVETAKKAMEEVGIKPIIKPIRGGTDGARLSYMGLPCPNIFTGGHNYHGKFEYIPVNSMEKAVEVIVKIIQLNAH
ncbi:peptidase T [Clostridiaceae bacterium 35-E11]